MHKQHLEATYQSKHIHSAEKLSGIYTKPSPRLEFESVDQQIIIDNLVSYLLRYRNQ